MMVQIRFHLELFLPERIDPHALNGNYRKRSDYVNGILASDGRRGTYLLNRFLYRDGKRGYFFMRSLFWEGRRGAIDKLYDGGL